MTGGFATIAGTVLAAFINFGIDPALLISASVMAAPAALGFSKLFYPETEKSKVTSPYFIDYIFVGNFSNLECSFIDQLL